MVFNLKTLMTIKLRQTPIPLSISPLIGKRISKSSGGKKLMTLSLPPMRGFRGSPLPDNMEKSVIIINLKRMQKYSN